MFDATAKHPTDPSFDFSTWCDKLNEHFYPLDCSRPDKLQSFAGSIASRRIGEARIDIIECSRMRYSRRSEHTQQGPSDDLHFFTLLEGRGQILQLGRQAALNCGDLCFYGGDIPFTLQLDGPYRALVCSVPRHVVSSRVAGLDRALGMVMDRRSSLVMLAIGATADAARLDMSLGDATQRRLGMSLVDILAVAAEVELTKRINESSRAGALLNRIKQFMLDRLEDTELDVQTISSALHVGPRTVQRLFAAEGTTTMRWLWEQRIAASQRALINGELRRVTDAAIRFGFTNFSHFSKVFKATYGISPSQLVGRK
jgi:AraC-like DNA-binding protein